MEAAHHLGAVVADVDVALGDAGNRTVAVLAMSKPELEAYLATYSVPGKKGLVPASLPAAAPGDLVLGVEPQDGRAGRRP